MANAELGGGAQIFPEAGVGGDVYAVYAEACCGRVVGYILIHVGVAKAVGVHVGFTRDGDAEPEGEHERAMRRMLRS